ncbi:L-threonylcarbamoyladenylate synthase [Rubrimonas cliftonensis]|uniref:Threonylcarbamoyl-AMP synthase n=1 Tax=Rubrimonas cliftonensis TaxID=89524 RepID=A0A1H3Z520_9RHOB|nr:L-threonylcarbamoyladenylate synthase [Rubrimonas cliftonensis]SEA18588.1 translation factor SUA5 [Rubrimonas cliftonensis]
MTLRWAAEAVDEAARAIREGGLAAFPTETVYGLGARADDPRAVAALFAAKGRPAFNPLIAHVADLDAARAIADLPPQAEALAERFWPGPLTLVAPRRMGGPGAVSDLAAAGLATVAVRVPAHPLAQRLLRAVGAPVAAPSANPSGRLSPTTAEHVLEGLGGRIVGVLDGGPCAVGVESSIVGFESGRATLLRPGGLAAEALEAALGAPLARLSGAAAGAPTAPGQLSSHYAPGAALRLGAAGPRAGEAWLGFGPGGPPPGPLARSLSPSGDLAEAAANLFADLRALDAALGGAGVIAVAPIPERGLGAAIADRLRRAAAPRPSTAPPVRAPEPD